MNEKSEPCRLFIEQSIDEAVAAGRDDYEALGREMEGWLKKTYNTELKARSLAQAARRAADPKPVTPVTKHTKEEKLYVSRATNQAHYEVAMHRSMAGEIGPLPDTSQAALHARSAISYLRKIQPDDPGRLEALKAVAEYLQTQGFKLFKPITPKE